MILSLCLFSPMRHEPCICVTKYARVTNLLLLFLHDTLLISLSNACIVNCTIHELLFLFVFDSPHMSDPRRKQIFSSVAKCKSPENPLLLFMILLPCLCLSQCMPREIYDSRTVIALCLQYYDALVFCFCNASQSVYTGRSLHESPFHEKAM